MNSKELESLCCIKNKLNERLMNERDETDIKKLRARLIKIQEDINKIENQRNSESKVQDFNNFYRQDEINRKIKELEPVLEQKQKEVDEAKFKLEKSKLELKRLLDKIETCESDKDKIELEIEELEKTLKQLKLDAEEKSNEINEKMEKKSRKCLEKQEIEAKIKETEIEIQVNYRIYLK
jgi:chromosome segregation ATPase